MRQHPKNPLKPGSIRFLKHWVIRAEVQSYLQTSDGKKIPLFYRLTDKSGSWKVYDIIIEGVSMVKTYRTQFRQILAKDSPGKLLQILRDKTSKT
jgi:phospholipid transport system substrate-binding protein